MVVFSLRRLFVYVIFFMPSMVNVAGASDADSVVVNNHIVARHGHDISSKLMPPVIMQRRFWNMLPYFSPESSLAKVMEKHILTEAMVHEAAHRYSIPNLRAAGDDPLTVSGDKLLALTPNPRVPFVLMNSDGRPPFRCMQDFRVDNTGYEKWKETHPNFLGFWAGVEWDNEYISPLCNVSPQVLEWFRKRGCSEAVLDQMRNVMARSSTDRDSALQGLHDCYSALRRYYFDDPDKMLFLRAGWCLDHYPLEWGAGMAALETTNTGLYRHQVSLFNVRGAARQYDKPWQWYIAMFYNGFDKNGTQTNNVHPSYTQKADISVSGNEGLSSTAAPGYGMSESLNRRDMYLAYLSGASIVDHESWPNAHCQYRNGDPKEWELSPHGEAMREWYAFTQRHSDRGVSYAPVALLLPFNQGMPQGGGSPWSHFPSERPDTMIDAFMYTVVPHSLDVRKGKEGCLSNSKYGDIYDILMPNPPSGSIPLATLMNYKVAIMLGKFDIDAPLAERLMEYVRQGGTLVINSRQVSDRLTTEFTGAKQTGKIIAVEDKVHNLLDDSDVTLAEPYDYEQLELAGAKPMWRGGKGGLLASVNRYGRGRVVLTTVDYMVPRKSQSFVGTTVKMPLFELLMRQIVTEVLPVEVQGDVEYGLCKVSDGWWVYLINNKGITKFTKTPEEVDVAETASVTVNMRDLAVAGARELREDKEIVVEHGRNTFTIDVAPGDIRIVKIMLDQ